MRGITKKENHPHRGRHLTYSNCIMWACLVNLFFSHLLLWNLTYITFSLSSELCACLKRLY